MQEVEKAIQKGVKASHSCCFNDCFVYLWSFILDGVIVTFRPLFTLSYLPLLTNEFSRDVVLKSDASSHNLLGSWQVHQRRTVHKTLSPPTQVQICLSISVIRYYKYWGMSRLFLVKIIKVLPHTAAHMSSYGSAYSSSLKGF